MKLKFICFLSLFTFFLSAQQQFNIQQSLNWKVSDSKNEFNSSKNSLDFDHSNKSSKFTGLPIFKKEFEVNAAGKIKATLIPKSTSLIAFDHSIPFKDAIGADYQIQADVMKERNSFKAFVELTPIRRMQNGTSLEILNDFEIQIQFIPNPPTAPLPNFTYQSALSNGEWHKISIKSKGVYKIDKAFLEKNLKLNFSSVDPRNIHIYGNGGTVLPESTDAAFLDDLTENAIYIKGENDGKFDDTDYILFYANGPDAYSYDPVSQNYLYTKNPYSNESFYFVKIDNTKGKRINPVNSASNPDYHSNLSFDFKHSEKDLENLLDVDPNNEGSGKNWYGIELSNSREYDFGSEFIFDNIELTKQGKFNFAFAGRSPTNIIVSAIVEDKKTNVNIPPVSLNSSISPYANDVSGTGTFTPVSDLVKAKVSYPSIGTVSEGWLDYFQIAVWKKLIWSNKPLYIMDPAAANFNVSEFKITNSATEKLIWDISDPLNITQIDHQKNGNEITFSVATLNTYKQFLALDETLSFNAPDYIGSVGNQNLHSLKDPDMIIIYNKDFKTEAERLQNHRSTWSNLRVTSVELSQVYNEFSSGSQDPTAIRNMMRMLYLRNPSFKYLVLFGDGSFDLRHIYSKNEDQNLMVTYETDESLDPITAFPSDDYFGLLDPGEGKDLTGLLDINIGRLCARTADEAKTLVDKIIRYDSEPKTLEDWKLNIVFSADDEDGNVHFIQAERISESAKSNHPLFNQDKIYLDAYQQITTPGGERYPDVNKAYANAFYQGALVINYLGHGGYSGLAQERVLQNTDIKALENYYKLPLVVIASCTFNGFDDPTKTTGGEEGLLNPRGGFLALFSTVRDVYSSDNFDLTNSVYKYLFEFENGSPLPLGEIMRKAKNENSNSGNRTNSRKFLLFGDPSQKLAIPVLKNVVTSINDKILAAVPDTFRALETVKVKGFVSNQQNAKQSDFSGKLYATVFDKEIKLRTKGNDPSSYPTDFSLQRNVIYKGSVEVHNGDWEFSFIVPKDINYEYGKGKISLYATDEKSRDAAGYESGLIIGGVSKDSIKDDTPPVVKVFLNDAEFVSGGICDPNPKLYSQISDDLGINISGNSIGHDLTAIIDQNTQSPIILNQVFKSKLNNPKEGELTYPLKNLSPGKHTITVTAWDISNNSGQGSTEFIVIDPNQLHLDRVFNYPNPFSKHTEFQFESNLGAVEMDVVIQLQSISGKVVKTIQKNVQPTGYRVSGIAWDGKDDFGSELANGVYLYRLSINAKLGTETIHKTSEYQKLLILK
jgi:hypothetical protein